MNTDLLIDIIKRVAMNPHNSETIADEIRPVVSALFAGSATASSLITVQQNKPVLFKKQGNSGSDIEIGDLIIRIFNDNELVTAIYNGGDENDKNNYTVYNEVNLTEE